MDELTIEQARCLLYDETSEAIEAVPEEAVEAPEPAGEPNVKDAVGLGVDIVEIDRMAALLARSPHFAERVFSEQ